MKTHQQSVQFIAPQSIFCTDVSHTTTNLTLTGLLRETKKAIFKNLIINCLFLPVLKRKKSKSYEYILCFLIVISIGLLSISANVLFMYIMYYIFKAGSIEVLSSIKQTSIVLILIIHLRVVHIGKLWQILLICISTPYGLLGEGNKHMCPQIRVPKRIWIIKRQKFIFML